MENISGYIRVLAQARVKQLQQKPFFGKPHLKLGQCLALWGYFFQLGGVIGAKHSSELDAFGHAFLGMQGEAGAVERYFAEVAENMLNQSVGDSTTFQSYVISDSMRRLNYTGDPAEFFVKFGTEKIKPETAAEVAWQYAEQGAALGAIYPQEMRKMFERSNSLVPKENWEQARAAGLDLPSEQDRISYEELEGEENEVFMAYCQECCPSYYAIFTQAELARARAELAEAQLEIDRYIHSLKPNADTESFVPSFGSWWMQSSQQSLNLEDALTKYISDYGLAKKAHSDEPNEVATARAKLKVLEESGINFKGKDAELLDVYKMSLRVEARRGLGDL